MSVIAENLGNLPILKIFDLVDNAVANLLSTLPVLEDGTIDLTGVRITYSEESFVVEKVTPPPVVLEEQVI